MSHVRFNHEYRAAKQTKERQRSHELKLVRIGAQRLAAASQQQDVLQLPIAWQVTRQHMAEAKLAASRVSPRDFWIAKKAAEKQAAAKRLSERKGARS